MSRWQQSCSTPPHFRLATASDHKIAEGRVIGKGPAQLLNYPSTTRMPGSVVVEDTPPVTRDDEETIENAKGELPAGPAVSDTEGDVPGAAQRDPQVRTHDPPDGGTELSHPNVVRAHACGHGDIASSCFAQDNLRYGWLRPPSKAPRLPNNPNVRDEGKERKTLLGTTTIKNDAYTKSCRLQS